MNDEPSSAAYANPQRQNAVPEPETEPSPAEIAERQKKNRENFNKRRGELLDDLIRSLDILIYAELSAVYYMDCSFFRFFLRAFVQLVFLTPKPLIFPDAASIQRPFIGAIFGMNIMCMLIHLVLNPPSAGEATRGYLHGGLAMDFIGQKGPTSKWKLLSYDILVLLLQVVHLSVHVLRLRLKEGATAPVTVTTSTGNQYGARPVSTGQSLDDEERGVRHSSQQERRDDIEMQTLNPEGTTANATQQDNEAESSERESLLASTAMPQRSDARIFDAFNSGQIVVADLDLAKTVKEQFWAYQKAPRDANAAEANRVMRERLTRRVMGWRFNDPISRGTLG